MLRPLTPPHRPSSNLIGPQTQLLAYPPSLRNLTPNCKLNSSNALYTSQRRMWTISFHPSLISSSVLPNRWSDSEKKAPPHKKQKSGHKGYDQSSRSLKKEISDLNLTNRSSPSTHLGENKPIPSSPSIQSPPV